MISFDFVYHFFILFCLFAYFFNYRLCILWANRAWFWLRCTFFDHLRSCPYSNIYKGVIVLGLSYTQVILLIMSVTKLLEKLLFTDTVPLFWFSC